MKKFVASLCTVVALSLMSISLVGCSDANKAKVKETVKDTVKETSKEAVKETVKEAPEKK